MLDNRTKQIIASAFDRLCRVLQCFPKRFKRQTRFVHERRYIAWQPVRAVAWQTVRAVAHFDLSFGVRFILHILRPKSTDPGVRTHRTNQHSCMKLLCTL